MELNFLYYAGYFSLILFLAGDIVGGLITPKYSYVRNAVSELIQSGSPNRLKLSPFFTLHGILNALFALGIVLGYSEFGTRMITLAAILAWLLLHSGNPAS